MKQNIPAGQYELIRSTYISLMDGGGTICENCGRIIANIVTVKHESGKHFCIGQDCAKTILSKQDNQTVDTVIKYETRLHKKLTELKKYNKPYVLNDKGWPCFPPEKRSGYYIPY